MSLRRSRDQLYGCEVPLTDRKGRHGNEIALWPPGGGAMTTFETCPRCGSGPVKLVISTKLRTFYVCAACNYLFSVVAPVQTSVEEETSSKG